MTSQSHRTRMIVLASSDPIRIVPLHLPDDVRAPALGAPPSPIPQLTYRSGPLLRAIDQAMSLTI